MYGLRLIDGWVSVSFSVIRMRTLSCPVIHAAVVDLPGLGRAQVSSREGIGGSPLREPRFFLNKINKLELFKKPA